MRLPVHWLCTIPFTMLVSRKGWVEVAMQVAKLKPVFARLRKCSY